MQTTQITVTVTINTDTDTETSVATQLDIALASIDAVTDWRITNKAGESFVYVNAEEQGEWA